MASRREQQRRRHARRREAARRAAQSASKAASEQPEIPDQRATFAQVTETAEGVAEAGTFLIVVEPIRLRSGKVLAFQSPHVVPFYLLTAKRLRDESEPRRIDALGKTTATPDGSLRPLEPAASFDALEGLSLAVILAACAIEAYANDVIRRLPDDAVVEVPTRLGGETVAVMRDKAGMDRLAIGEKLTRVVPLLTGNPSIKGTKAWQAFRRVNRLRNDLVHVKPVAQNDADKPGPFGVLMLGEGSRAPEDAASVIEALEPGWLPAHVRPQLGLT